MSIQVKNAPARCFNSNVGLKNLQREVSETRLRIGTSLSILESKADKANIPNPKEWAAKQTGVSLNAAAIFTDLNRTYVYPSKFSKYKKVRLEFLSTVPTNVLRNFIPHFKVVFDTPQSKVAQHIVVTDNSIEVEVPLENGVTTWKYLSEITEEQARDFDKLVESIPANSNSSVPGAPTADNSYGEYSYDDSSEMDTSDEIWDPGPSCLP